MTIESVFAKRLLLAGGVLGVVVAAAAVAYRGIESQRPALRAEIAALDCPAGTVAEEPAEVAREFHPEITPEQAAAIEHRYGERVCLPAHLPEAFSEYSGLESARQAAAAAPYASVPVGAFRAATQQRAALATAQASVPYANGRWQSYGLGVQVTDAAFPDGSNDGIPQGSGRVDNFAYDPVARRLFAAVGNGGIWVSDAVNRDVATLGNSWRSISETLPSLVVSAVAWTPAGAAGGTAGGTVIALTGENTQGGNSYVGLGVYWSNDLGKTWNHASGVPDGAFSFRLAVDASNPAIVYAATGKGLYRSADAGRNFVNVKLPTSDACKDNSDGACGFANFVTDVVVQAPGGLGKLVCDPKGCPVLAGVGFRAGPAPYADGLGTPQAPGNGLYRSSTGEAGSFAYLDVAAADTNLPVGFTTRERVGRIALGNAYGPAQDHNYVYAIVEDAVLFNGGLPILGLPSGANVQAPNGSSIPCDPNSDVVGVCGLLPAVRPLNATSINGVYVSNDFGSTWTRIADPKTLTYNPATGSALAAVVALGVGPGIQAWYNLWIKPDPTQADPLLGAPLRLQFGMEEIWKNRVLEPVTGQQQTPVDFKVFGAYFAGKTCLFLIGSLGVGDSAPVCPTYDGVVNGITTHPDQHDAIYIPDDRGGVWMFVGNDGGINKQYSSGLLDDYANNKWGNGSNNGFATLMHYGVAVAKDGTVYYGNQDNASGKIEPDTRREVRIYVGDGVWTAVDPDNSKIAYYQTPGLALVRTTDGGATNTSISPDGAEGLAHFLSPFVMDPLDAKHLVASGTAVAETLDASTGANWTKVYDLGTDPDSGVSHITRSLALANRGDASYAGWCGPCNLAGAATQFQRGIATNVGGAKPPKKGTSDGWHQATMQGLPNRYIYNIAIDPVDPKTIYVVLGGYSTARWAGPGQYLDRNPNLGSGHVFKSTDAGESFTDISGDLPDVVTTAVLRRGNQIVVGTDLGVFISRDLNGTNWAPLGDLPAVPVNQLVLKPGDDTQLFAATFGRGTQVYTFNNPPTINAFTATPTNSAAPLAAHFSVNASDNDAGDTLSYRFDFGDGTTAGPQADPVIDHTYAQAGSYTASVIVADSHGATATAALTVVATDAGQPAPGHAPNASLIVTPSSGAAPLQTQLDASGSHDTAGTAITSYRFDFGDGSTVVTQSAPTIAHTYAAAGTFQATVIATNSAGQSSAPVSVAVTVTTTVTVTPATGPVAALLLTPTSGSAPLTVSFDGSKSFDSSGGTITQYVFSFGDGSAPVTLSSPFATHVYTTPGSYTPSLSVRNASGQVSARPAIASVGVAPASGTGTGASGSGTGLASGKGGSFGWILMPLAGFALLRRRRR